MQNSPVLHFLAIYIHPILKNLSMWNFLLKILNFKNSEKIPLSLSSKKKIIATKKNNLTNLPSFVIYHAFRSERNEQISSNEFRLEFIEDATRLCEIIDFPSSLRQVRTCSRRSPACEEKSTREWKEGEGMANPEEQRTRERGSAGNICPGSRTADPWWARGNFPFSRNARESPSKLNGSPYVRTSHCVSVYY